MSRLHAFLASSMRTRYTVDISEQLPVTLTIGALNARLDHLLMQFQAENYAYLTAYNPNSTSLNPLQNQLRHEQLCSDLHQRGFTFLTGRAIPDTDAWEPEVCVFVFNISRPVVLALCQAYAQDGAVVGERGSAPKLLFTSPKLREDFQMLLQSCVLE